MTRKRLHLLALLLTLALALLAAGCGSAAMSGGLPPSTAVERTVAGSRAAL